jgi:hypothetical protein
MDDSGPGRTATMVETPPDEPQVTQRGGGGRVAEVSRRAARSPHTLATAGFLALTVAVYWPVIAHFSTRILADAGDGAFYLWNQWSFPRRVLGGHNPFHTGGVFHPLGADLGFDTILAPVNLASWPLQKLFGLAVAANAAQLSAVVLSALGAYLLALQAGATAAPAFVAGAAFAFTPYRTDHIAAHFNLNHTELLPFGLLVLLRLYDRPGRGRAAAVGVVAAIAWWSDSYYSTFLVIAALLIVAWRWRDTFTRPVLTALVQAVAVAGVLTLPLLMAMAHDLHRHELDAVPGWGGADVLSADVVSWIAPPEQRRFLPDMVTGVVDSATRGEQRIFPTWTLLAVAAAGLVWGGRRRGVWLVIFATFFVLSLGPFLQVNGWTGDRYHRFLRSFSVPMPYQALRAVPIVNGVRAPGRFAVVAILALAVLAALALTRLERRHRRAGLAVSGVVLALILAESLPKTTTTLPAATPAAYRKIAADPGRGAVLEIPLQWHTGYGNYGEWDGDHSVFLYYATEHGKPVVNGVLPRYPVRNLDRLQRLPVYDQLLGFQTDAAPTTYQPLPAGRPPGEAHPPPTFRAADLEHLGIGYVVYHRDRPRPAAFDYLTRLGLPVLADDGTVIVWKVP